MASIVNAISSSITVNPPSARGRAANEAGSCGRGTRPRAALPPAGIAELRGRGGGLGRLRPPEPFFRGGGAARPTAALRVPAGSLSAVRQPKARDPAAIRAPAGSLSAVRQPKARDPAARPTAARPAISCSLAKHSIYCSKSACAPRKLLNIRGYSAAAILAGSAPSGKTALFRSLAVLSRPGRSFMP
jgi:hypothetical protein